MWSTKKFIIVMAIAATLAIASVGGVVLAQGNEEENDQPEAQHAALLERVCEIYEDNTGTAIDADDLQTAFTQAQNEIREEALQNRLQGLVDDGKITQEQADELLEWWEARPEDLPFGFAPMFSGMGGHVMMHRGFGGPGGSGPPSPPEGFELPQPPE
jgi:hypothetical protein